MSTDIKSITSFDELNRLVGMNRSMPFDTYFGEMKLTDAQKRQRIALAERLEDEFLYILSLLFYTYPTADIALVDELKERYMQVLRDIGIIDRTEFDPIIQEYEQRIRNRAEEYAIMAIATTLRHSEDPYYYSADRARFMSEDQSCALYGEFDFATALSDGMEFKTWETIWDNRVRNSHMEVEGLTIPIDDVFVLEGGMLQFPGDDSMGADTSEICGCRCSLSFS